MSESLHQQAVIQWFRRQYPYYAQCVRLSLNGIALPNARIAAIVKGRAKREGMVVSESDLFFAIPNDRYHGLFLEMKNLKASPTDEQVKYLAFMNRLGYQAQWARGADEGILVLKEYMQTSLKPD